MATGDASTDVFIGYCEAAKSTAADVIKYIESEGYTVLDWAQDFNPSANLMDEIERARSECALGLFLFTKDDERTEGDPTPRDNVVFECGYFWGAKGKNNVLIVLEDGAKPPTDITGTLWLPLPDRKRVGVKAELLEWLRLRLGQRTPKKRRRSR